MSTIGERLRAARQDKGISQRAMADAAGMSQSAYSDLERGESVGRSLESLARMARFLNVSADYLLGNEEEKTVESTLAGLAPLERELIEMVRGMRAGRRQILLHLAKDMHDEERRERRYLELVTQIEKIDESGLLERLLQKLYALYGETGDMRAAAELVSAEYLEVVPESDQSPPESLQDS